MGMPLIKQFLFLLVMLDAVYTRQGMCMCIEEEVYAHEFY